LDIKY